MKRALICGISGQDGAYLAQQLLAKGYTVFGSSRDAQTHAFGNLTQLGIRESVALVSISLNDFRSVLQALARIEPDEVYNLAGQSSVGLSFEQPVETMDSIALAVLNLLEALRFMGRPTRMYNACSSECFGDTGQQPADESFAFRPRSPYAVAKSAAYWQVANYREAYGLFACSGLLFNHESPLRPERFVTRKVVNAAVRIAAGSGEKLHLGNMEIRRDWGWAPEYVDAMWRMLQHDQADDYVIATGRSTALRDFVAEAFTAVGLDWKQHVVEDRSLFRPTDLPSVVGNPRKAEARLGWTAQKQAPEVVRAMIDAERQASRRPG